MRATAVFQFYLPYTLPRDPDWNDVRLPFKGPDHEAVLSPRASEADLFPESIDRTLSTMSLILTPIALPVGRIQKRVCDEALDRIQVQVSGELQSTGLVDDQLQQSILSFGVRVCNTFLHHCRLVAETPFVHGLSYHFRAEDGHFYLLAPYTISWFDSTNGKGLPAYQGGVNAMASPGAVRSPERGVASMSHIVKSLQLGPASSLETSLTLTALEHITLGDIEEAVVTMATACEVASNSYMRRMGITKTQAKNVSRPDVSFAEKFFADLTQAFSGKSLKRVWPDTFASIEEMYRARNNVVHQGRCGVERKGAWIEVDAPLATAYLAATRRLRLWLLALPSMKG